MNEQNVLPYKIKSTEEARKRGRNGGLARGPNKAFGAKLRWMKKKGMTDENVAKIYDMMVSGEYSAGQILLLLDELYQKATDKDKKELIKLLLDWHKIRHGTKDKSDINISLENKELNVTFVVPEELKDGSDNRTDTETTPSMEAPSR